MTDSCNTCGKTSSLMNCKRCKSVAYCSAECQQQDWKTHKPICQRKEFSGAPCDCCGTTEDVEDGNMCINCGSLFCAACNKQLQTRDLISGQVVSFAPCPRCNKGRDYTRPGDRKKLEKLIKESPRDPRLANWLVELGGLLAHFDDTRRGEQKAKEHFLRAGELGLGEGFTRIAEICIKNRNWDEAKRFYKKAAEKFHVIAIYALAVEARTGYFEFNSTFKFGAIIQEDHRRPPDWEEAIRLYREGAQLGDEQCCIELGFCYFDGKGVEKNLAKAFKWYKKAAEKGHPEGMRYCADCYLGGEGVEQCNAQAIYWYEKLLELEDDEDARHNLEILCRRHSTGSSREPQPT